MKQECIGFYVIMGMFYIWMFCNFLGNVQVFNVFFVFLLGVVIGLFIVFFINIFFKISVYVVGMGGLLGMVVIILLFFSYDIFFINFGVIGVYEVSMYWVLMFIVFLAGFVGICCFILQVYELIDFYGGYFVGFVL